MACNVPRDSVAKFCDAAPGEVQVESAQYRAILSYEYVISPHPGILLSEQCPMLLGEMFKEVVAPIGDESREVVAICQLEGQDGRFMIGAE